MKGSKFFIYPFIILVFAFILHAQPSYAQTQQNLKILNKKYLGGVEPEELHNFFEGSFLFSSVERALIQKAIAGKVDEPDKNLRLEQKQKETLNPEDFQIVHKEVKKEIQEKIKAAPKNFAIKKQEKNLSIKTSEVKVVKPQIPAQRLIQLSGLIFRGRNDWVVWINGQKVTPNNYLPEIIEIKVENSSYVGLKWYDIGLQEVISITLRPNQTYDITTGILLPGY